MLSGVQVLFCNRIPSPLTTCTSKFLLTTVRPIHVLACWRRCACNPGAHESCCHMNIQWLNRKMIACSCYAHVLQTSVRLLACLMIPSAGYADCSTSILL